MTALNPTEHAFRGTKYTPAGGRDNDMRARTVLAVALLAGLAGLAGCSAAGSLSMTPVDGSELADEASRELPSDPDAGPDRAVVRDAIRNGSATANGTDPSVDRGLPYVYDGGYYDLTREVVGEQPGYETAIEVDLNATEVDGETIDYRDLPAVDRERLGPLLEADLEPREPGYDVGLRAVYSTGEAESSVLVPDQVYEGIVYEGETYGMGVDEPENVTLQTYRYESTVVAESAAAYAEQLRDRYEFELSGLSDGEREVVSEAAGGSYYADSDDDEAFASLVDRFRARGAVSEDREYDRGNWLVRYEGQRYWAQLEYSAFADDGTPSITPPSATPTPESG